MGIAVQNKASFFYVEINYTDLELGEFSISEQISIGMDIALQSMQSSDQIYRFDSSDRMIYLFSTEKRKREGQLRRYLYKHVYNEKLKNYMSQPKVYALLKKEFKRLIETHSIDTTLKTSEVPEVPEKFPNYNASDIAILDDKKNWFKWQEKLYSKMFYANNEIRLPNPEDRKIIFIYDPEGFSGKSTFYKWLYYHNSDCIGCLTIGSSSQLRSSLTKIPYKSIYLFDLSRSLEKTVLDRSRIPDLMSVVEELKNGLVIDVMYGNHNTILQNRSHCVISSNFLIDPGSLSKDRLEFFEITKNKQLLNITDDVEVKFMQQEEEKKQKNPVY